MTAIVSVFLPKHSGHTVVAPPPRRRIHAEIVEAQPAIRHAGKLVNLVAKAKEEMTLQVDAQKELNKAARKEAEMVERAAKAPGNTGKIEE